MVIDLDDHLDRRRRPRLVGNTAMLGWKTRSAPRLFAGDMVTQSMLPVPSPHARIAPAGAQTRFRGWDSDPPRAVLHLSHTKATLQPGALAPPTPYPRNYLYSGPNLRRGVAPVPRVFPRVGRGRAALHHRSNGRCRGRGRRASGVETPGEAPGRSRLRRRVRPHHPRPACVAWRPCCGGQVNLRRLCMGRARTRYIGDLGKSRQSLRPKAWQTHRNAPHGGVDFYPLLAKVGKPPLIP